MLPAAGNLLYRVAKPKLKAPVTVQPPGAPYSPPPVTPDPYTPPKYDYSTDPGLVSERTNALTDLQTSQHGISARQRLALLGFGNRALAMKTLGLGANDPFIQSIDENADTGTGTLARLAHAYRLQQTGTDEGLNKQNLFYSGARVKALAELAYGNNQQVAEATRGIQASLEGLTEEGAGAHGLYNRTITGAEEAAQQRAVDFALQYPQAAGPDTGLNSTLAALAAAAAKKPLAASTALTMYTK